MPTCNTVVENIIKLVLNSLKKKKITAVCNLFQWSVKMTHQKSVKMWIDAICETRGCKTSDIARHRTETICVTEVDRLINFKRKKMKDAPWINNWDS